MKKVIIAHVSKQHSFHTAIALKKQGMLYKYITTVYDKPSSLTMRAKSFLKGNTLKKANTRYCPELTNDEVLQFYELLGLLRIFFRKWLKFINIDMLTMSLFWKKVVKYAIKENVDAIMVYDGLSKKHLDILKKKAPHIEIMMDVTIASRPFMKEVFTNDMDKFRHKHFLEEEKFLWKDEYLQNTYDDCKYVDHFFVPSKVVYNSLKFCGVNDERLITVPYGVSVDQFTYVQKKPGTGPLKLIFVGGVMYRKGVHHLLEVVSQYTKEEVVLSLAGGYNPEDGLYQNYKDKENIHFLGFVTRDVITRVFQESDAFVLPSLAEGLALVILEALATGTPVICTENSGGNDAITNYENGIVCKVSDRESFNDALQWMIANPDKLPEMSAKARESSLSYTWDMYYKNLGAELHKILD
jgi:glycosyltransferase involved in cell wall biosynthesis